MTDLLDIGDDRLQVAHTGKWRVMKWRDGKQIKVGDRGILCYLLGFRFEMVGIYLSYGIGSSKRRKPNSAWEYSHGLVEVIGIRVADDGWCVDLKCI